MKLSLGIRKRAPLNGALFPLRLQTAGCPTCWFCTQALRTCRSAEFIPGFTLQYHQSVDKLPLYVFGPLVFAAALLVVATGIRRAVTRFRSRPTPDQLKATYDAYLR